MATTDQPSLQLRHQPVPLFANGFEIQVSNADVMVVFSGGAERYELHISMTLAKTLGVKLNEVIRDIEDQMGQPIITADKMNEIIETLRKKKSSAQ
ncbi:MAG: hypothetical protein HUU46_24880 [Candidatus Hydrogenedentes bacterium]|nr:hypothetical protein [Candidatus Hydrogenedentota bacterium]